MTRRQQTKFVGLELTVLYALILTQSAGGPSSVITSFRPLIGSMLLTFDTSLLRSGFGPFLLIPDLLGRGTRALLAGTSSKDNDLDPFEPFARATFTALSTREAGSFLFVPTAEAKGVTFQ
jgi:hypothetical protein